jgi:hypothetical protein
VRDLRLTSPLTRGHDVVVLQRAINARAVGRSYSPTVHIDGVYGPSTEHATDKVAYELGIDPIHGATVHVQHLIEHPHLRNPGERARAIKREHQLSEAAKRAGSPGHGLAAVVAHARSYIGIAEQPPGSNWGNPYPAKWEENFGFNYGVSWCGCFSGSMVLLAGGHVTSRVAYCPYIESDARSHTGGFDHWEDNHQNGVGPGWLVLYCWDGSGVPEHVGVVESIHSDYVQAIEGNTGGTNPSDGGMVARMQRPYNFTVGYARPRI